MSRHPHYEIIKALIEDTSLEVEVRFSPNNDWREVSLQEIVDTTYRNFEARIKPSRKKVVSSMTIEEIEGLHNSIMGSRAHYRAIANAAAAQAHEELIDIIRHGYIGYEDLADDLESK